MLFEIGKFDPGHPVWQNFWDPIPPSKLRLLWNSEVYSSVPTWFLPLTISVIVRVRDKLVRLELEMNDLSKLKATCTSNTNKLQL